MAKMTFNEDLVLEYLETNDEDIFIQIINTEDVKKYVNYVCRIKLANAPTTLFSHEDFVNIAYLIIWQSIKKYRFLCPVCGKQAKTASAYKLHTITKHEEYIEPKTSINKYLKFNLGSYLQNEIRREYSLDRKSNVATVNLYSPLEEDELDGKSRASSIESELTEKDGVESPTIFKDVVESAMKHFDEFTKDIFNYIYIDRLRQTDIAEILYKQGKYSTIDSARVVVSRTIRKKISPCLIKYYPELS